MNYLDYNIELISQEVVDMWTKHLDREISREEFTYEFYRYQEMCLGDNDCCDINKPPVPRDLFEM